MCPTYLESATCIIREFGHNKHMRCNNGSKLPVAPEALLMTFTLAQVAALIVAWEDEMRVPGEDYEELPSSDLITVRVAA